MASTPDPVPEGSRRSPARPVMKEVADRAGVAMSSVSRVLNGHPDVSEVMRHRVLDAVAALRYEPDMLAQSLRTGATMTVGFLAGDISNPLISQIAMGSETTLRMAGYSTMLTNSLNSPTLDAEHLRLFQQRRVDGLLLSLSDETSPSIRQALTALETPVVLVDRHVDGSEFAAVHSDHATGIRQAVDHLVGFGHKSIGMINGNPRVRPSRERAGALRRACRATAGVAATVKAGAFTSDHGYRATIDLFRTPEPPTAVIAGSNQILVGVLRGLRELGLSIPADVSLVTCDDIPLAEFLTPRITTVSRNFSAMGERAAQLLLEQLDGAPPRTELLPTGFRAAESCAPPRHPTKRRSHG